MSIYQNICLELQICWLSWKLIFIYSRDPLNDHFNKETTSVKGHFLARTEYSSLFHVSINFTNKTGLFVRASLKDHPKVSPK